MAEMKAMEFTDKLTLRLSTRLVPQPQAGEILIQIYAAGVTLTEKLWYPTTHYADGSVRSKAIPGHEFSGVVAGLGAGVNRYRLGDVVFGLNDWFAEGAIAEFCITKPSNISLKPSSLSFIEAASVPIGSLTAWQGLHDHAKLRKDERVLIHGGAGAVGLFAVQLAKLQDAYVIATASKANIDFVKKLGANEVIDYRERRFEEVGMVDVIFDTVGGETLNRSLDILQSSGRLITIAADAESSTDPRVKNAFFIVEQNGDQLASLGKLFDSGQLIAFVKAELPMEEADQAYSGSISGNPGKLVILIR
ncbi:NADP-dependent oxidoreductase [Acidicapsa dinghuensis]|uniref:NADP-dependent oxidoreductase n=1 Tax=Acidicapsa dinghuensis TaxID=2218256 RepID=A0ABW1EL80_9BACT|nr:NADP-dependent oxidoreductase [Acidicapsa dinghuensis]